MRSDTVKVNKKNVRMVAHRGVSGLERENTLPAFVAAGNRSYYGVETDVWRTRDGKYVLLHDGDTNRVAAGDKVVAWEASYDLIRSVQLTDMDGSVGRIDLRVPSLQEYISVSKKYVKKCILELKGEYTVEYVDEICDIIDSLGYLDGVIFISFSLQNLKNLRVNHPDQPAQFLVASFPDWLIDALVENRLGLDIYYPVLTEEHVKALKEKNIEINIWTCDNADDAQKYIDMGVDYITSNILE